MKEYEVKIVRTVTQEEIENVMITALEGGINYWCGEARVKKEPVEEYNALSDVLTRGGSLELYDFEEEKWHELTIEKLIKALGEGYDQHGLRINFDFDQYDQYDVDSVIQIANSALN